MDVHNRLAQVALALAFCLPAGLPAQIATPAGNTPATNFGHAVAAPSAIAVKRANAVVLDGKLDDAAWKDAAAITDFTQSDPLEGKPPTQRTEVRFLYDDDALYVGARMYDSLGAKGVTTRLVRRDGTFDSDYFQLIIDGYHDHLSRAFFEVNPSGSQSDYIGIGTSCCDPSWDPIWEAVTSIDSDGWTAEIRIPYSQLRFSRAEEQVWGLQLRRFIRRNDEEDDWAFWHKNEAGGPSRFGHLLGLHIPPSSHALELMPYASVKSSSITSLSGTPFDTKGSPKPSVGLDLRDRVTSNLTLNATINPDFGQVEVDPAVLNLSAFETFFPEKRPFFVENSQVFNFGSFSCHFCSNVEGMSAFYSRRVGRAPTGAGLAYDNHDFADVPEATTILGAAKLTGRTSKGYTVGFLDAVTGNATARVQDISGIRGDQLVEPLANYYVGRLKRDYRNGNFVVGGVASGVMRHLDTTFAARLADHAEMYGSDVYATTADKKYTFTGQVALTNVTGDPRAIVARQQSSARYYQRPDRGDGFGGFLTNRYDVNATALRGLGAYARVAKETGEWWWELAGNTRTPGYETNDYAFMRTSDYIWTNANVLKLWLKRSSWYQSTAVILGLQQQQNYEGNRDGAQFHQYWEMQTHGFWQIREFIIHRPSVLDDRALRGGPLVGTPRNDFASMSVSTDRRHAVVGDVEANYYWDEYGGTNPALSVSATYRPAANVGITFGPSWNRLNGNAQYLTAIDDPTSTAFYGRRYVFGASRQTQVGLDTRFSLTVNPRMTLELYAQPFFASGHFFDFNEYAAPRHSRLSVYGRDRGTISSTTNAGGLVTEYTIDPDGTGPAASFVLSNPDFTDRSLRGNAVFRWEYRPGSLLYVAWTQSRFIEDPFGDLRFTRERNALFGTKPDNIFLIKASYWLPM
ncbi:MAG TPA: DUF5916 domain-containing protein [Gemmatimonadaceae bacterium]|nr:DUF5916 domain-containing protein [Gemmatimonadaceae bacterium]